MEPCVCDGTVEGCFFIWRVGSIIEKWSPEFCDGTFEGFFVWIGLSFDFRTSINPWNHLMLLFV